MVRSSGRARRTALAAVGLTAAGLVAAVGLNAGPGARPAGAAAPPPTVAPGAVWGWGINFAFQADPVAHDQFLTSPKAVAGLPRNAVQVAAGVFDAYALLSDGTVRVWGANSDGQFGNGTATGSTGTPANVLAQPTGLSGITQVAASDFNGYAIGAGGIVYAWGDNVNGQIGDGTTAQRTTPVQIPGLSGIRQVAANDNTAYAVGSDGTVWSWGTGINLLGDGTTRQRLRPARIPGLTGVTQLATSNEFVLALLSDGTVRAWGNNFSGEIGINGTANTYPTPQRVLNLAAVQQVAAGGEHGLAIDRTGRVWAWGHGQLGEIGDGGTATRTAPVLVPGATGISQVAAGLHASLALRSDGAVLGWGDNAPNTALGALGVSSLRGGAVVPVVTTPEPLVGRDSIKQVAMGAMGQTTYALTAGLGESYGFVLAGNPTAALNTPYSPSTHYAADSAGSRVSVTRTATGAYTVDFPGLAPVFDIDFPGRAGAGPGGNVQVTAFGNTANHCQVNSWFGSLQVLVSCTSPAGAPADTSFVAQYFQGGASLHHQAYLWAEQPTAARYLPNPAEDFNSAGDSSLVLRTNVGQYMVDVTGLPASGGNVAVSAHSSGGDYCKARGWGLNGAFVSCFNTAGAPVDAEWTLRYTDQSVANNGGSGAYVLANNPATASYTPDPGHQWSSAGTPLTITRSATGSYQVLIPGLASVDATSAMATAVGDDNTHCAVNGWAASGTGTAVKVLCHNPAGALADAVFALSYLTNF